MKEKIKKILIFLKKDRLKIFIVLSVIAFLLIQWANFNVSRYRAYISCRSNFEKEDCLKVFSIQNLFFPTDF